ncbi:MAG: hypothetical protein ACHRXM_08140 [Isosphaerales bacterium]
MAESRRQSGWFGIELAVAALALGGLVLGFSGIRVSRAQGEAEANPDIARQVTVIGIIATPGTKTADSKLVFIKSQLDELLPKHGFRLLDAQSARIVAPESVTCNLNNGYTVAISLVKSMDENGKVEVRCELFQDKALQFSTLVKTPVNQLFFCQRALQDGSQLLIGVGAR